MSFNKRYIRKGMILDNPNNISYISNLVNADALIIDSWSDKFFKNFNFKWKTYNQIREDINKETMFDSHHNNITNHDKYKDLFKLSNVLLNLKTNPSWIDIVLTQDILKEMDMKFVENQNPPEDISGKFTELVPYHIELIERYYEQR